MNPHSWQIDSPPKWKKNAIPDDENVPLTFSTIRNKSNLENLETPLSLQLIMHEKMQFSELLSTKANLPYVKEEDKINGAQARYIQNQELRKQILLGPEETMHFKLIKKDWKGKKTGRIAVRDCRISQANYECFLQVKEKEKTPSEKEKIPSEKEKPPLEKFIRLPGDFIAESKADYLQKASLATKPEEKQRLIPWNTNDIVAKDYRIMFTRNANVNKTGNPDSFIYFETKEEFIKMKNYLKLLKLLDYSDHPETKPNNLLQILHYKFKLQLAAKFRWLLRAHAKASKNSQRISAIKKSSYLANFNSIMITRMIQSWTELQVMVYRPKPQEKEKRVFAAPQKEDPRQEKLISAVSKSDLLHKLDKELKTKVIKNWEKEARNRGPTDIHDIIIIFNTLEIDSQIIHPKVEVEVKVDENKPKKIDNSQNTYSGNIITYRPSCRLENKKGPKENPSIYCWRVFNDESSLNSSKPGQTNQFVTSQNLNEQFSLKFDGISTDNMKKVHLQFTVLEEPGSFKTYCGTSLDKLLSSSQRGRDVWVFMNAKGSHYGKTSLLHLKVFEKIRSKSTQATSLDNMLEPYNLDVINDTAYNYNFKFPSITPKHHKLLDLLPPSWNIMDNRIRSLKDSNDPAQFVFQVKSRLAKVYHENSTRQLASLNKNVQLWSDLQESLAASMESSASEEQPCISQNQLIEHFKSSMSTQFYKPGTTSHEFDGRIFYLFKRDVWETKEQWKDFYSNLKKLCQRGLPSQYRLELWSELAKSAYFILVTEKEYFQRISTKVDDMHLRSKKVYEHLKSNAEKEYHHLYQELDDNISELKEKLEVKKVPWEPTIRTICKTFIFWTGIFNRSQVDPKTKYHITYSRAIVSICYGILISQNGRTLEGTPVYEEDEAFWLLISMCSYVFSDYFQIGQDSMEVDEINFKPSEGLHRKKNALTEPALTCSQTKGIKSDLMLLKLLLKKYEPQIYNKLYELGLPLEYYFADHIITLFIHLFNPGLAFRVWDVLFFEASSLKPKHNRMIACFLYMLLNECKEQILIAKKPKDVKMIIELYAKFTPNYGDFIRKAYNICDTYLDQTIPQSASFISKLDLIKYALFTDQYNQVDSKIVDIGKKLEENYAGTLARNRVLSKLLKIPFNYPKDNDPEFLSYPKLSKMIRSFISNHGIQIKKSISIQSTNNPANAESRTSPPRTNSNSTSPPRNNTTSPGKSGTMGQSNSPQKASAREKLSCLHVRIHRAVVDWFNLENLSICMIYGEEKRSIKLASYKIEFEAEFFLSTLRKVPKYLEIAIFSSEQPDRLIKLKSSQIDLALIPANTVLKVVLELMDETSSEVLQNNFASEVEISLCLKHHNPDGQIYPNETTYPKKNQPFIIPEFENVGYESFKTICLEKLEEAQLTERSKEDESFKCLVFPRNHDSWKEDFMLTLDQFLDVIKTVAPTWEKTVEFKKAVEIMIGTKKESEGQIKRLCLVDFLVLLVLFAKLTLKQKANLLFELLSGFQMTYNKQNEYQLYVSTVKGICHYLYETFMVYLPRNEVVNIVEQELNDDISVIKKVILNGKVEKQIPGPREILNNFANFMQLHYQTKEIHLYDKEILDLIKEVYSKQLGSGNLQKSLTNNNTLDIKYFSNGMNHKLRIEFDQNWNLIQTQQIPSLSTVRGTQKLPAVYQNVLGLNSLTPSIEKSQFIRILQKIPLINYLSSSDYTIISNALPNLAYINIKVEIEGELVYMFIPDSTPIESKSPEQSSKLKKNDFYKISQEWERLSSEMRSRANSPNNTNLRTSFSLPVAKSCLPRQKVGIYSPYQKLIDKIKKQMIKEIFAEVSKQPANTKYFHPYIFLPNLLNLDYDIYLTHDGIEKIGVDDIYLSPFETLMEHFEDHIQAMRKLDIIISLKNRPITPVQENSSSDLLNRYEQLALYYYPDGSNAWLPCRLNYAYQNSDSSTNFKAKSTSFDGYGVIFAKYPQQVFLKKSSEVAVLYQAELETLDLKIIDANSRIIGKKSLYNQYEQYEQYEQYKQYEEPKKQLNPQNKTQPYDISFDNNIDKLIPDLSASIPLHLDQTKPQPLQQTKHQ